MGPGSSQRGQASLEYAGLLAVAGILFAAVVSGGVQSSLSERMAREICWMPVVQRCPQIDLRRASTPARSGRSLTAGEAVAALGGPRPDPREVARILAALPPPERRRLALSRPEVVGGLDGAPVDLRYTANRVLMRRSLGLMGNRIARLDAALQREPTRPALTPDGRLEQLVSVRADTVARDRLTRRRAQVARWAEDPSRRFLVFDPDGDGRVAEAFGDLERAPHVAVMVPGMGSDIDNFERYLAPRARQLRSAGADSGDDVATVAWLGYDPPDTLAGATLEGPALSGGRSLRRLMAGIEARSRAHTTVIGHSYGSVTAGSAAGRRGLAADDLVFTGSPGTGEHRIDVSQLAGGSRVWAAEGGLDLVPWAPVHGEAPSDPGFGARVFDASGRRRPLYRVVENHQRYYAPGSPSLVNIARISAARGDEVTPPALRSDLPPRASGGRREGR